jgi:hypothetical protein
MFALSCDAATTIEMMQNTSNTKLFRFEATPVASTTPCPHFDLKRRFGYVLALAGGPAR